jgi:hypothetical protein
MKNSLKINLLTILFTTALISGCAVFSKMGTSPYEGKWSYTVDTPDGIFKGFLTILKDGKIYSGNVTVEDMTIELSDLKIEDGKLTASLNAEGYPLEIKGEFNDDVFSGDLIGPDFTIPFSANKVKE